MHDTSTFDNFVVLASNKHAHAAARSWALRAIDGKNLYVLIGPPGTGKSHLAHAARKCLEDCGRRVMFRTAEELVDEVVGAIRDDRFDEFVHTQFDHLPVLVLEHMEYLSGKDATTEEVVRILRYAISRGTRILATVTGSGRAEVSLARRIVSSVSGARLVFLFRPRTRELPALADALVERVGENKSEFAEIGDGRFATAAAILGEITRRRLMRQISTLGPPPGWNQSVE